MLPKSQRLSTEAFKGIIEKGQSIHGPFLILRVILRDGVSHFAVSVPKKVAHTAVLRNKIRRRIYSILRKFPQMSGFSAIFILKNGSTDLSFAQLEDEIHRVFVKSGILK